MIRLICTALVILGLIFQPFAVARSASMSGRGMDSSVSSAASAIGKDNHNMSMADEKSTMARHENKSASTETMDCDNCCEMDCTMVGHCATSCTATPFAATQPESTYFEGDDKMSLASNTIAHPVGQSSLIYHPPKHS